MTDKEYIERHQAWEAGNNLAENAPQIIDFINSLDKKMIKINRADATNIIEMLEVVKLCGIAMKYPHAKELSNVAERLIRVIEKELLTP